MARQRRQALVVVSLLVAFSLFAGLITLSTGFAPAARAQDEGTPTVGELEGLELPEEAEATAEAEPPASPEAEPAGEESAAMIGPRAFVSGTWRFTVSYARHADETLELNLDSRTGRDWVAIVLDATNWGTEDATLQPAEFGIRLSGSDASGGFAKRTTEATAELLGVEPTAVDEGLPISAGDTVRIALVFQLDDHARDPALTYEGVAMPLDALLDNDVDPRELPGVIEPPELETVDLEEIVDGGALVLEDGDEAPLAGIEAPEPDECYGGQAIDRLRQLAGTRVELETLPDEDGAGVYAWKVQSDGSRLLVNRALVAEGYAAASPTTGGAFAAWLGDVGALAQRDRAGLWAACTGPHGVAREPGLDRQDLTVRVDDETVDYELWVAWAPLIVPTPDGGAHAFFSAEAGNDDKRLFSAWYDPSTGDWEPATALPGGAVQFGPSAVVDSEGRVHLVYSDRVADEPEEYAILYYTVFEDGDWSDPTEVAPSDDAGHQISASLAIDDEDRLYLLWQDQREWSAEHREASAANADIFASELVPGSEWSDPQLVNIHQTGAAGSRPDVVVDGDRVVAIWSIYETRIGLESAARVEWAWRPLNDTGEWSEPMTLVAGRGEQFGGRLLDLHADPTGGVVFVYGRRINDTFLFLRRLEAGQTAWGPDVLLTAGNRGTFPSVTVNNEGTTFVVYNLGTGALVDVGGVALAHESVEPGPEMIFTDDEQETQGRPVVATDVTGAPWIIYFNENTDGVANEIRAMRNLLFPRSFDELNELQG